MIKFYSGQFEKLTNNREDCQTNAGKREEITFKVCSNLAYPLKSITAILAGLTTTPQQCIQSLSEASHLRT